MPPRQCEICQEARAQILRPKNHARICAPCFIDIFEREVAATVTDAQLFHPGEKVAIGASGGKDSTVLASVLKTLNDRHEWGLDLVLLSVDEGITGYRDHSLEAVKRHSEQYGLPLKIVSYAELYGWSMDQVVAQIGKKGNCTYCGVFRRQALDRGAAMLGVGHVVTGHNADDASETILMNLLRGDLPRLSRSTNIVTSTPSQAKRSAESAQGGVTFTDVKRSKPLMYAYEKEIVMYAHYKKLDYFSTECIYSPEAFRGSARTLIKNLERIRPESILDIIRSGIDMAKLVPDADGNCKGACGGKASSKPAPRQIDDEQAEGGCGSSNGQEAGGEMAEMEKKLLQDARAEQDGTETEIKIPTTKVNERSPPENEKPGPPTAALTGNEANSHTIHQHPHLPTTEVQNITAVPIRTKKSSSKGASRKPNKDANSTAPPPSQPPKQKLGHCERCGYLSSQTICKACVLLEGLNKARPKTGIEVG
ncbi:Cytoplasmic tRNA 2-thiolation protein [Hortaea werneckii]|uniref:Cytoplasmic tRNA 2-thiolation protein 1 n=1 Tax=Hortaea werneckii TaxID=91943 RepID=A0A3M7F1I4_HORWE|nr:Cytoplasmic tRNA 2-thiolation protein [Hortaea werneckii]KAI6986512.1 Cytoplasmic tRNA 2-thiolation protein [Hortaea werneckii]KAI7140563.1 Cytoplasmic tRNA 2-thiolation protein [Hortaea werneckii]KAI7167719.1 Cytoplasmic tRNA 2-thiolation protein [Hortaea werneckii]KAI7183026.1 Cytoplasmic tRNA 2-thiolation protein [Hortaea werneckii]